MIDDNPDNREAGRRFGVRLHRERRGRRRGPARGRDRAREGVIACVDSDAENIFITLTARELRDDILIIARASAEDSEKKLLRAGADRVISPYKTSGAEMARVALHPQVGGAVEVAEYRMEEIEVSPDCEGVGRKVEDVRGASMIVALRRPDGRLEPQPAPDTVIDAGDKLVALGTPDALERLEEVFQPASVGEGMSATNGHPIGPLEELAGAFARRPRPCAGATDDGTSHRRPSRGSSGPSAKARATTRPTRDAARAGARVPAAGDRRGDRGRARHDPRQPRSSAPRSRGRAS